jgi:hypothetical protein
MFAEDNSRVWSVVRDWLRDYFPAQAPTRAKKLSPAS